MDECGREPFRHRRVPRPKDGDELVPSEPADEGDTAGEPHEPPCNLQDEIVAGEESPRSIDGLEPDDVHEDDRVAPWDDAASDPAATPPVQTAFQPAPGCQVRERIAKIVVASHADWAMETMGIEPTTPALQRRCSPN